MPYFLRTGEHAFMPTEHTGGAWNTREIHIAPVFGLLTHLIEQDRTARGRDGMRLGRLSFDILGPLPLEEYQTEVTVLRPGKSVELVEAVLSHGGRPGVRARAWLLTATDTAALAGSPLPRLGAPETFEAYDPTTVWPGGMIASIEVRRRSAGPGDAQFWIRSDVPLLDEPVSALAQTAALFDIANGMAVRRDPTEVAFPNVDLTVHLFRDPEPGWLGYDTAVSFGPAGTGLTQTTLHDENGPIGAIAQILAVREQ